MKRIKLFEAFTNINKIEAANITLLRWIIRNYINDADFDIEEDSLRTQGVQGPSLNVRKYEIRRFSYYPNSNTISNINMAEFYPILSKYKVKSAFNLVDMSNPRLRAIFHKSAHRVLKKIYLDEENKTI